MILGVGDEELTSVIADGNASGLKQRSLIRRSAIPGKTFNAVTCDYADRGRARIQA